MSLPERLDDLARLTGMPALAERMASGRQRRHLRWFPIAALLLVSIGMALMLADSQRSWLGYLVLVSGNVIAAWLPIFGPIKPWGEREGADERERQVRRDAYFTAFAAISIVTVIGLSLLMGLTLLERWRIETLLFDMAGFILFLISLWEIIPTLHASWATRPLEDE
jgi:hypothetical protein